MAAQDGIARRLRLRDLHMLQVLAERGSMARAAESLALTQPAISKAVAEMERDLGVPLLERSARGVTPTAYGRVLLARGTAMLDELHQGIEEMRILADPSQGEVRIGTTEPMTAVVSLAIQRLFARHPRMRFQVEVAPTKELLESLRGRALDLAVTRLGDARTAPDLRVEVLFEDALAVLVDRRHPLVRRRQLDLADLAGEAWAIPPHDSFLGGFIAEAFRHRGLTPPQATVFTRSVCMWLAMLRAGRFLGMGPSAMLRFKAHYPDLAALPVSLEETRRPVALVALAGRRLAPAAGLLAEAVRSATSGTGAE